MAITNLAEALMQLGDWDAAEAEYTQAVNSYGLADMEVTHLLSEAGWRRCAATPTQPRRCWRR